MTTLMRSTDEEIEAKNCRLVRDVIESQIVSKKEREK